MYIVQGTVYSVQCGLDPLHSQERGVGLQNPELGGGLDNKKLPAPTHSTERSMQSIVYSVYCTGAPYSLLCTM